MEIDPHRYPYASLFQKLSPTKAILIQRDGPLGRVPTAVIPKPFA